jgi:hypothetical protein
MTVHLVGENLRAAAQSMISGCDQCCDCPEITFDCILDELTVAIPNPRNTSCAEPHAVHDAAEM